MSHLNDHASTRRPCAPARSFSAERRAMNGSAAPLRGRFLFLTPGSSSYCVSRHDAHAPTGGLCDALRAPAVPFLCCAAHCA